jgi:predicted transcriptional regulator
MTKKKNPHVGSTFESWLDEQGIREEVAAAAIKEVIVQQLTPEEEASLEESLAQAERGEFATDEQMQAIWAKHGL